MSVYEPKAALDMATVKQASVLSDTATGFKARKVSAELALQQRTPFLDLWPSSPPTGAHLQDRQDLTVF